MTLNLGALLAHSSRKHPDTIALIENSRQFRYAEVDILARRVANHAGEITDEKMHLMAEVLKLAHLVEEHRVSQVKIRSGWIEAGLHLKRPTARQPILEFALRQDFLSPSP